MRLVRIDDFPHGDKMMFYREHKKTYRDIVHSALSVFEKNEVPYILGVTPLLLQEGDIDFLNKLVKVGKTVTHGFTHGWDKDWNIITSYWPGGGEFFEMTKESIEVSYKESMKVMKQLDSFLEEDFIPPFNCFTQTLLDVLKDTPVKRIHTCSQFWQPYAQDKMNYYDMEPVVSNYGTTYCDANVVINNLQDESQITLHWCYDYGREGWLEDYQTLCNKIKESK